MTLCMTLWLNNKRSSADRPPIPLIVGVGLSGLAELGPLLACYLANLLSKIHNFFFKSISCESEQWSSRTLPNI